MGLVGFVAETTSQSSSDSWAKTLVQIAIPIILGGFFTALNIWLKKRPNIKNQTSVLNSENFKAELDSTFKQREYVIMENKTLYEQMKQELEACREERREEAEQRKDDAEQAREERIQLTKKIDDLQKRLNRVEIELQAWEVGLKTPPGFVLVKTDKDDTTKDGESS